MPAPTIADSFVQYRRRVIPPNATPIQIEECRRAFYAGTYFLLMHAFRAVILAPEAEAAAALEALQRECESFACGVTNAIHLDPELPPWS